MYNASQMSVKDAALSSQPGENFSNQAACPSLLPVINDMTEHMNNTFVNKKSQRRAQH